MPYISPLDRVKLDEEIDALIAKLASIGLNSPKKVAEFLNYSVTRLVLGTMTHTGGVKYSQVAMVTGVLQNVADEFYRRVAGPYENSRIEENGDVYEYAMLCEPLKKQKPPK